MRIVFFHRKRVSGAFSIENLFEQIRNSLSKDISFSVKELSFPSKGFFKRIYILLEAAFNQEQVNHITGDVHFIALFLKKRCTVLTIHDIGFMRRKNPIARYLLRMFWITIPVKRSAVITVVSKTTKLELLKYLSSEYASKIKVVYNPIKNTFLPCKKQFNEIEPVILQIGTKHNKNLLRLIQALSGISCRLEIIGDISKNITDELRCQQVNYAISQDLTDEEILNKYHTADIVSFVSTHEGFGLPIIEANAVGRVVVTSNVSSMPEIAGEAAHFVDPFNVQSIREGFLKVIRNADYREELIVKGFENRKRFDITQISGQYQTIYYSLV